jgi:hypothetical protein
MSFTQNVQRFESNCGLIQSHLHKSLAEQHAARRVAYRAAAAFKEIKDYYQAELVDYLHREGFSGKNIVDQWLDKWFAPYKNLGHDYRELLTAVEAGMTEKDFLKRQAGDFIRAAHLRASDCRTTERPLPGRPADDLPLTDQVKRWRQRAIAAEAQNRELRQQVSRLESRCARLEKTVKQFSSTARKALAS